MLTRSSVRQWCAEQLLWMSSTAYDVVLEFWSLLVLTVPYKVGTVWHILGDICTYCHAHIKCNYIYPLNYLKVKYLCNIMLYNSVLLQISYVLSWTQRTGCNSSNYLSYQMWNINIPSNCQVSRLKESAEKKSPWSRQLMGLAAADCYSSGTKCAGGRVENRWKQDMRTGRWDEEEHKEPAGDKTQRQNRN